MKKIIMLLMMLCSCAIPINLWTNAQILSTQYNIKEQEDINSDVGIILDDLKYSLERHTRDHGQLELKDIDKLASLINANPEYKKAFLNRDGEREWYNAIRFRFDDTKLVTSVWWEYKGTPWTIWYDYPPITKKVWELNK